jgi:hypothetical protein
LLNHNTWLGRTSLWTSISGIVVPVGLAALALVVVLVLTPQSRLGPKYGNEGLAALAICGVLFVILELVALACGIAARRTATGKIGMTISGVMLTLALGLTAFALYRSDFFKF